jgi:hypothetical protein
MWRQANVIAVHQHSVTVRELLIYGLEFELWFVATVERALNYSRLCFACSRIFYVTNRLRAIRPIPKAVPHDLVGHGACRGGNVMRGPLFSRRAQRRVPFFCYPNPSSRLSRLSPAD